MRKAVEQRKDRWLSVNTHVIMLMPAQSSLQNSYSPTIVDVHTIIWWLYNGMYDKNNRTCFNLLWNPADQRS